MGCAASIKFADLKNESLPEPEAPLPPDPRLPLDPWQKFYLEKSWKTVARNIDKAGMIMFVKLLRDYPEIQQKWPQLRHLADEEKMERPFLESVRACLEDRFTYKYEEIYSKFIIFIIETVVIGFDPH
uniref:Uncharacterized protein n=1 Tax=Branchiostoma floridae TaxID=7739 RepID=C3YEF2_BRAFL|eukprot:XP_002605450.1 hypothetical protein BRAFLDRAFT_74265 [Branchiostoma floridae]